MSPFNPEGNPFVVARKEEAPESTKEQPKQGVYMPIDQMIPGIKESMATEFQNPYEADMVGRPFNKRFNEIWEQHYWPAFINPEMLRKEALRRLNTSTTDEKTLSDTINYIWKEYFSELGPESAIFHLVENQVVVDLGAGSGDCMMYNFCSTAGAKGYVGVDKFRDGFSEFFSKNDEDAILNKQIQRSKRDHVSERIVKENFHAIPGAGVKEDMLAFLRRLPDKSVSVITNGIDYHVIESQEYRNEVGKEIERVLHPEGVYITLGSDIPIRNLKDIFPESDDRHHSDWRPFFYRHKTP